MQGSTSRISFFNCTATLTALPVFMHEKLWSRRSTTSDSRTELEIAPRPSSSGLRETSYLCAGCLTGILWGLNEIMHFRTKQCGQVGVFLCLLFKKKKKSAKIQIKITVNSVKTIKKFYWSIVDLQCCFSFRCTIKWKKVKVTQLCPALCDLMDL